MKKSLDQLLMQCCKGVLCTTLLAHAARAEAEQFVVFNLNWGARSDPFGQMAREFNAPADARLRVGLPRIDEAVVKWESAANMSPQFQAL